MSKKLINDINKKNLIDDINKTIFDYFSTIKTDNEYYDDDFINNLKNVINNKYNNSNNTDYNENNINGNLDTFFKKPKGYDEITNYQYLLYSKIIFFKCHINVYFLSTTFFDYELYKNRNKYTNTNKNKINNIPIYFNYFFGDDNINKNNFNIMKNKFEHVESNFDTISLNCDLINEILDPPPPDPSSPPPDPSSPPSAPPLTSSTSTSPPSAPPQNSPPPPQNSPPPPPSSLSVKKIKDTIFEYFSTIMTKNTYYNDDFIGKLKINIDDKYDGKPGYDKNTIFNNLDIFFKPPTNITFYDYLLYSKLIFYKCYSNNNTFSSKIFFNYNIYNNNKNKNNDIKNKNVFKYFLGENNVSEYIFSNVKDNFINVENNYKIYINKLNCDSINKISDPPAPPTSPPAPPTSPPAPPTSPPTSPPPPLPKNSSSAQNSSTTKKIGNFSLKPSISSFSKKVDLHMSLYNYNDLLKTNPMVIDLKLTGKKIDLLSLPNSLKMINLTNDVISINKNFSSLPQHLMYLYLDNNKLKSENIESLNLTNLKKLKLLSLENNLIDKFISIPDNLEYLLLDGNNIPKIENVTNNKLKVLSLNNNQRLYEISNVKMDIIELYLNYCSINNIDNIKNNFPKLEILSLTRNKIKEFDELPETLEDLYLDENTEMDIDKLKIPQNLLTLYLNKCDIEKIDQFFINNKNTNIEEIFFGGNEILDVLIDLKEYDNLKILFLNNNNISQITISNSNLEYLYLNNNPIKDNTIGFSGNESKLKYYPSNLIIKNQTITGGKRKKRTKKRKLIRKRRRFTFRK